MKSASLRKANSSQKQQTAAELAPFSLAASIEAARNTTRASTTSQHRKIFNIPTSLRKKAASHQSLATNSSFVTAYDSPRNDVTPAESHFSDFSDSSVEVIKNPFSSTFSSKIATSPTNTEIFFSKKPEETMSNALTSAASKASAPVPAPATTVAAASKSAPSTYEAPHDITQNMYSGIKGLWAWGKTVPIVTHVLSLTEAAAAKVLELTFKTDLPAVDKNLAEPNLKKLDDAVITPAVAAAWKYIGPALKTGDEMIVKPVMTHVVPKVMNSVGMGDVKTSIDNAPNPEFTSVPIVN